MPSCLKARAGKLSYGEMREQLEAFRKPPSRAMETLYRKYRDECLAADPRLPEIDVRDDEGVNWRSLIMSLPPPQNTEILGCGIRKVKLKETECVYEGQYRFHVVRRDRSEIAFDFRDAYDDAYHNYKDKSFKDDVETALRAAVLPQLIQYKEMLSKDSQMELVSHISGIALPWEKAVVQHFPMTFQMLVDAFLNENQIKIEQVKLEFDPAHAYRIKEPELLDKWQVFHRSQAVYRIISTEEAMEQDHL